MKVNWKTWKWKTDCHTRSYSTADLSCFPCIFDDSHIVAPNCLQHPSQLHWLCCLTQTLLLLAFNLTTTQAARCSHFLPSCHSSPIILYYANLSPHGYCGERRRRCRPLNWRLRNMFSMGCRPPQHWFFSHVLQMFMHHSETLQSWQLMSIPPAADAQTRTRHASRERLTKKRTLFCHIKI